MEIVLFVLGGGVLLNAVLLSLCALSVKRLERRVLSAAMHGIRLEKLVLDAFDVTQPTDKVGE